MIHVHVRNPDGSHLIDADAYRVATAAIQATVGSELVVQITTEAVGKYSPAEQRSVVRSLKPEAASIALRELVPNPSEEGSFSKFLGWMKREAVAPQIILYDASDVRRLQNFRKRGLVPFDRLSVLFVLGRYTVNRTSSPADLLEFVSGDAPTFEHWSVCAFGAREIACVATSSLLGGHVRVGFENNETLPNGDRASNNAALVAAAHVAVTAVGLKIATADELRAQLADI